MGTTRLLRLEDDSSVTSGSSEKLGWISSPVCSSAFSEQEESRKIILAMKKILNKRIVLLGLGKRLNNTILMGFYKNNSKLRIISAVFLVIISKWVKK